MSKEVIEALYANREQILIIGLTGRTGSGCSKVAEILSTKKFSDLDLPNYKTLDFKDKQERQYSIIYNFMKDSHWIPFDIIEVSSLIFALMLQGGIEDLVNYLKNLQNKKANGIIRIVEFEALKKILYENKYMFDEAQNYIIKSDVDTIDQSLIKNFYLKKVVQYKHAFKKILSDFSCQINDDKNVHSKIDLYTFLLQNIGNNIRCSGKCYSEDFNSQQKQLNEILDAIVNLIIKDDMKNNKKTRICIDALRNQYEIDYLREKYKSFYCLSINVDDETRRKRLTKLTVSELENLDKVEYPNKFDNNDKILYHQNIQGCIETSDIHIYNPDIKNNKYYYLTQQLVRYITLMLHPGLVVPTKIERCMQQAFVAKLNSGCLSRKVGAVITDDNFSIKAVGWNEVPDGQISCGLRNINDYKVNKDKETFSEYELQDMDFELLLTKIQQKVGTKLKGIPCAYCFKDLYNSIEHNKNQVHTRSLHAEENAFLQLSKYDSCGIYGGKLFVTASPCELCSKKAYQLGIKEIYYIDPYPGIANSHILKFGDNNNPKLVLYNGAIGAAYMNLYTPKIPLKDEIAGNLDVNTLTDVLKVPDIAFNDLEFESIEVLLTFCGSTIQMCCCERIICKAKQLKSIYKQFSWTCGDLKIIDYSDNITIENLGDESYIIDFKESIGENDIVEYNIKFDLTNPYFNMRDMLSYYIKYKTQQLKLVVKLNNEINFKSANLQSCVFADRDLKKKIEQTKINPNKNSDECVFIYKIEHPNVNYTYAICWDNEILKD